MDYGFSDVETIYIYGYFKKELAKLEQLKNINTGIDIKKDIKLCQEIVLKMEGKQPQLLFLGL